MPLRKRPATDLLEQQRAELRDAAAPPEDAPATPGPLRRLLRRVGPPGNRGSDFYPREERYFEAPGGDNAGRAGPPRQPGG